MCGFVDPLIVDDNPVLIRGESGVRRDRFARAVHAASTRRGGPFIKVNCAAIPPELRESQLFGHEKGPVPDAHRHKRGQVENASRGTLYLDEVGELPLVLQERLLYVLQYLRFSRVGHGTIASTNRDLEVAIARGEFMEDLYYRLNVVEIRLKPERDEGSDDSELDLGGR
jgi:DNA-binding NtrC family response regulator